MWFARLSRDQKDTKTRCSCGWPRRSDKRERLIAAPNGASDMSFRELTSRRIKLADRQPRTVSSSHSSETSAGHFRRSLPRGGLGENHRESIDRSRFLPRYAIRGVYVKTESVSGIGHCPESRANRVTRGGDRVLEESRSGIPVSIIPRRISVSPALIRVCDRHTFKDDDAAFSLPLLHTRPPPSSKTMIARRTDIVHTQKARAYVRINERMNDRSAFTDTSRFPRFIRHIITRRVERRQLFPLTAGRLSRSSFTAFGSFRYTTSLPYHLSCLVTHRNHFFIIMSRSAFPRGLSS